MKISTYSYYGFFTKFSILDDYGFINGLLARVGKKLLPDYLEIDSFERYLLNNKNASEQDILDTITKDKESNAELIRSDVQLALVSFVTKITSFGLDKHMISKFNTLGLSAEPLINLNEAISNIKKQNHNSLNEKINLVNKLFKQFKKGKPQIGTSIQMTYKTQLVFKYLERLKNLVALYYGPLNMNNWSVLINEYKIEYTRHRNIISYLKSHFNLLLLLIVEHTSSKGEKYIAENRNEYLSFLKKSMKGGALICCFAFLKIWIDTAGLSVMNNAIFYSINYALCFIVVKYLGGLIATKQPAMTASTIAKYIDNNNSLKVDNIKDIIKLIKNTSRSQFISLVGNVSIALPMASLLFWLLSSAGLMPIIGAKKLVALEASIQPTSINLYYAAVAGVFLAASGFISGYVDNKMLFRKYKYRIKEINILKRSLSTQKLDRLSSHVAKNTGTMIGNICLGVFLGSAFLVNHYTGLAFDIRHIAFSASYLGVLLADGSVNISSFIIGFAGVWMIGLTNFLVSFIITSFVTFKTRRLSLRQLTQSLTGLSKAFISNPMEFIIFKKHPTL